MLQRFLAALTMIIATASVAPAQMNSDPFPPAAVCAPSMTSFPGTEFPTLFFCVGAACCEEVATDNGAGFITVTCGGCPTGGDHCANQCQLGAYFSVNGLGQPLPIPVGDCLPPCLPGCLLVSEPYFDPILQVNGVRYSARCGG